MRGVQHNRWILRNEFHPSRPVYPAQPLAYTLFGHADARLGGSIQRGQRDGRVQRLVLACQSRPVGLRRRAHWGSREDLSGAGGFAGRVLPVPPDQRQRRAARSGDFGQNLKRLLWLGCADDRHAGLDNPRFFTRNRRQRIAEQVRVVVA